MESRSRNDKDEDVLQIQPEVIMENAEEDGGDYMDDFGGEDPEIVEDNSQYEDDDEEGVDPIAADEGGSTEK